MISVELLSITPNSEILIALCYRICTGTEDLSSAEADARLIRKCIKDGHLSPLEHGSATFHIVSSRVALAQISRHRLISLSVQSQRYVEETEANFITPKEMVDASPIAKLAYLDVMKSAIKNYKHLRELGVKKETARYLLPGAWQTQMIITANFRQLIHMIDLRTSKRALPELQELFGRVREIMKEEAPIIFGGEE